MAGTPIYYVTTPTGSYMIPKGSSGGSASTPQEAVDIVNLGSVPVGSQQWQQLTTEQQEQIRTQQRAKTIIPREQAVQGISPTALGTFYSQATPTEQAELTRGTRLRPEITIDKPQVIQPDFATQVATQVGDVGTEVSARLTSPIGIAGWTPPSLLQATKDSKFFKYKSAFERAYVEEPIRHPVRYGLMLGLGFAMPWASAGTSYLATKALIPTKALIGARGAVIGSKVIGAGGKVLTTGLAVGYTGYTAYRVGAQPTVTAGFSEAGRIAGGELTPAMIGGKLGQTALSKTFPAERISKIGIKSFSKERIRLNQQSSLYKVDAKARVTAERGLFNKYFMKSRTFDVDVKGMSGVKPSGMKNIYLSESEFYSKLANKKLISGIGKGKGLIKTTGKGKVSFIDAGKVTGKKGVNKFVSAGKGLKFATRGQQELWLGETQTVKLPAKRSFPSKSIAVVERLPAPDKVTNFGFGMSVKQVGKQITPTPVKNIQNTLRRSVLKTSTKELAPAITGKKGVVPIRNLGRQTTRTKTRVIPQVKLGLGTKVRTKLKTKTLPLTRLGTRAKQKTTTALGYNVGVKQLTRTRQTQATTMIPRVLLRTPTRNRQTTPPPTFTFLPPPVTTPTHVGFGFGLPSTSRASTMGRVPTRAKFGYLPSFKALAFKQFGTPTKKKKYSGLEYRPIPKGFSFQKYRKGKGGMF